MTATHPSLLDRIFHALANFPSPEDVLAISMTPEESRRVDYLIQRKKDGTITPEELQEAREYMRAERYVQLAKTKALMKLREKRAA